MEDYIETNVEVVVVVGGDEGGYGGGGRGTCGMKKNRKRVKNKGRSIIRSRWMRVGGKKWRMRKWRKREGKEEDMEERIVEVVMEVEDKVLVEVKGDMEEEECVE